MNKITIRPRNLSGTVTAPPSKSLSHRVMIAAALSSETVEISGIKSSVDIQATKNCLETLGAVIEHSGDIMRIRGAGSPSHLTDTTMFCAESGSTLRFMIPIAAVSGHFVRFEGKGKLVTRPIDPYFPILEASGVEYEYEGQLPLKISGALKPGEYDLPGHISSQFVTGLLFALPLLEGDSVITISTRLESRDYVDLTLDVLSDFGIRVVNESYERFLIPGKQQYLGRDMTVEGDYSQMAFWAVAAVIGEAPITIQNVNLESSQGDARIFNIIEQMGGRVEKSPGQITVYPSKTRNICVDVSEIPDLVPILAVLGTFSEGEMTIIGGERVRLKESDRLKAIAEELNKLGGHVVETHDGLVISGAGSLHSGTVDGWNDHRIVMAMAVAAIRATGPVSITGWQAISKSYPEFFKDYESLGGELDERNLG